MLGGSSYLLMFLVAAARMPRALPLALRLNGIGSRRSLLRRRMTTIAVTTSTMDPSSALGPPNKRPKVVLSRGKARLFREGERLVYGGAVSRLEHGRGVEAGGLVDVVDGQGTLVGWVSGRGL